ncbi:MAG: CBS domain-containing protein [Solirubrobacteraceae bacterium]
MSPRSYSEHALHTPEPLHVDDDVESAVRKLVDSGLPALPVVDRQERFAGIFGEREFMGALFPGYLRDLKHAAFLSKSIDETLEKREGCRQETVGKHMNTEHVEVAADYGDTQIAEIFLNHRVLVVPVVDKGHVKGVLTRGQFFRAIADAFVAE